MLLANSVPGNTWCEQVAIDELDELLDIDLSRLSGAALGSVPQSRVPLCSCARMANVISAVLSSGARSPLVSRRLFPDVVWECSHTSGLIRAVDDRAADRLHLRPAGRGPEARRWSQRRWQDECPAMGCAAKLLRCGCEAAEVAVR